MSSLIFELQNAYDKTFGNKPKVPSEREVRELEGFKIDGKNPGTLSKIGSTLEAEWLGRAIWLPTRFYELDVNVFGFSELFIPFCTVDISAKKTIVKTPLAERQGSVREQYSVEDYQINVKGFFLGYDSTGKYPQFPEAEITQLKQLFEINEAIKMDNALVNIFLAADSRVVMEDLRFPDVEGGKKNYRPFSFKLESDSIFTLEL